MATLVVDIGNTLTKVAVFNQEEMLLAAQYETLEATDLLALIRSRQVTDGIVCSVKKEQAGWQQAVGREIGLMQFALPMARGISIRYGSPETLGMDRLAGVLGARHLFPGRNSLVIAGGTCITYDLIDEAGTFSGGSISPGLQMRYRAMHAYTGGLPLVEADRSFEEEYGRDTAGAIRSGVQNGIRFELLGFIGYYMDKYPSAQLILSGGDSEFFGTLLKNSIFAPYIKIEPYLVLKGLNAVLLNDND